MLQWDKEVERGYFYDGKAKPVPYCHHLLICGGRADCPHYRRNRPSLNAAHALGGFFLALKDSNKVK